MLNKTWVWGSFRPLNRPNIDRIPRLRCLLVAGTQDNIFVTMKVESDGNYGLQIGLQSIFLKNSRVLDRFRLRVRPNIDRIQKLRCLRIRGTKTEFFSKGQPNRLKNMASRSFQTFLQESLHTVCSKNGNFQIQKRNTSNNRNHPCLLRHDPTTHKNFLDRL